MPTDLAITYPAELPITERRDELAATIEANQVVIVAGETGSGKSTQLPKLCLELGRGAAGLIGHTQPRRLAARTIAERIAAELDTPLGRTVGYAVRFDDTVGPDTRVKVMTDGILLAEIPRDRTLDRYDTIIIDEAHERSLNIDFILGYLRQLLPRRPDLKVIVTSATIDTERFSAHFDDAPVIEVSGRTYPVEIRYRPLDGPGIDTPLDDNDGIVAAVQELWRDTDGDVLVFCSGEREIRDAADAVADLRLPGTEILPLYARLSAGEQQRVFRHHDKRRVVIATNVAETSVTVPGIRSVVDVGTARISRYSTRTKVQRLPIEPISQASADQRAGRCGRLGPGVCIRLYAEDDYDARPPFTEPEIQRTNLAAVILRMADLGLGDIEDFGFVDPPDPRAIRDGIAVLTELDALDPDREGTQRWLTPIGRKLARIPVDPRYGRMLLEADNNGCVDDVMIIAAALSIQDPRERPADAQAQADDAHRRFAHPDSDFLTLLNLWDHLATARRDRSGNQFRRLCRREYLNYHRVIEWFDIHRQLRQVGRDLGMKQRRRRGRPADHADRLDDEHHRHAIHRSLLAGLLTQVGARIEADQPKRASRKRDGRQRPRTVEYLGVRNTRFAIGRGSSVARQSPKWVMAAELVETNRLWARTVAAIDPDWLEDLAAHIATYSYGEPWWDPARGSALVTERVSLHGLTIAADRAIQLGTVDRSTARELFIHHALVEGEWDAEHPFVAHNAQQVADVHGLEARTRRRDLLVEHQARFDFFDRRIPDHVISAAHFDSWWGTERKTRPDLLELSVDDLLSVGADELGDGAFPDSWIVDGIDLEVTYEFDPTSHLDGVSIIVPVEVLNQLHPEPFRWNVPGLRRELVEALIRGLPKATRRDLLPITDTIDAIAPQLDPSQGPLIETLALALGRRAGTVIPTAELDLERVPGHLRPTFRVVNERYELLAEGKELDAVRRQLDTEVRTAVSELAADGNDWERSGLRTWDVGTLPRVVTSTHVTGTIRAYPALVDDGDSVAVRLLPSPEEQADSMWLGVRRLLRLNVSAPARRLDDHLDNPVKLLLVNPPVQSKAQWYNDAIDAALDAVIADTGGPPWTEAGFDALTAAARAALPDLLAAVADSLADALVVLDEIQTKLDRLASSAHQASLADVRAHLGRLAYPGFLAGVGMDRHDDVIRYLTAIARRLDGLVRSPVRDAEAMATCRRLDTELATLVSVVGMNEDVEQAVWLLEELRVQLFAQSLGTNGKVSEKRVRRTLDALRPR